MPLMSLPCQIRFLHSFILLPINTVCSHEQNEFLSCSFCDVIGQVDSHTARSWIIKPEVTLCKLNHVETTSRKFTLSRELFWARASGSYFDFSALYLKLYKIRTIRHVFSLQGPLRATSLACYCTRASLSDIPIALSYFGRLVLWKMIVSPLVALALAISAISAFAGPVQKPDIRLPRSAAANKAAVVDIFTRSYDAYRYACILIYFFTKEGFDYKP